MGVWDEFFTSVKDDAKAKQREQKHKELLKTIEKEDYSKGWNYEMDKEHQKEQTLRKKSPKHLDIEYLDERVKRVEAKISIDTIDWINEVKICWKNRSFDNMHYRNGFFLDDASYWKNIEVVSLKYEESFAYWDGENFETHLKIAIMEKVEKENKKLMKEWLNDEGIIREFHILDWAPIEYQVEIISSNDKRVLASYNGELAKEEFYKDYYITQEQKEQEDKLERKSLIDQERAKNE